MLAVFGRWLVEFPVVGFVAAVVEEEVVLPLNFGLAGSVLTTEGFEEVVLLPLNLGLAGSLLVVTGLEVVEPLNFGLAGSVWVTGGFEEVLPLNFGVGLLTLGCEEVAGRLLVEPLNLGAEFRDGVAGRLLVVGREGVGREYEREPELEDRDEGREELPPRPAKLSL